MYWQWVEHACRSCGKSPQCRSSDTRPADGKSDSVRALNIWSTPLPPLHHVDALGVLAPELGCFGRFPAKYHKQRSYTQSSVIKELSWQVSSLRRSLRLGVCRASQVQKYSSGRGGANGNRQAYMTKVTRLSQAGTGGRTTSRMPI